METVLKRTNTQINKTHLSEYSHGEFMEKQKEKRIIFDYNWTN